MKIEKEIRDAYGPIKPLPGGEDRMWIAIDRALDGKAKDVQIQLRPHRKSLRPFLTAAAVIALLLMSLALLRTLRPDTRLCVAAGLTTSDEWVRTLTVAQWKKEALPDLHKTPAIFLIHRGAFHKTNRNTGVTSKH